MSEPTPRPWREDIENDRSFILDQHDDVLLVVDRDLDNAAHIVKCVNLHDEMIEVIKDALADFNIRECYCDGEYIDGRLVGSACYYHRIEGHLEALIAKAGRK